MFRCLIQLPEKKMFWCCMRLFLKNTLFYLILLGYLPFHLPYILIGWVVGFDSIFQDYSQALSLVPGTIGKKVRGVFYFLTLEQCSKEVAIDFGTFFVWRSCRLGRNVYIGARCIVSYADIHDDVLIGSHVNILSGKEQHSITDLETPIRLQGGKRTKVVVGRDSWIGNGALIMADVGSQSVVAAGSVLTKEIEPLSIVGGNPAHLIKKRGC